VWFTSYQKDHPSSSTLLPRNSPPSPRVAPCWPIFYFFFQSTLFHPLRREKVPYLSSPAASPANGTAKRHVVRQAVPVPACQPASAYFPMYLLYQIWSCTTSIASSSMVPIRCVTAESMGGRHMEDMQLFFLTSSSKDLSFPMDRAFSYHDSFSGSTYNEREFLALLGCIFIHVFVQSG
jgi:hypothetical protein